MQAAKIDRKMPEKSLSSGDLPSIMPLMQIHGMKKTPILKKLAIDTAFAILLGVVWFLLLVIL